MIIKTGKELIDLHITKFEVINGGWIGYIEEIEGQKYLYCGDKRICLLNEYVELDYIIKPLCFENSKYQKIYQSKENIKECISKINDANKDLLELGEESEYSVQSNFDVKEYQELKEKATPKAPIVKLYASRAHETILCPVCGNELNKYKNSYCECGQKIEWNRKEIL